MIRLFLTVSVIGLFSLGYAESTWMSAERVSGPGIQVFDVAEDSQRNFHALWMRKSGGSYLLEASLRDQGGIWMPPTILSSSISPYFSPSIFSDEHGDTHALWEESDEDHEVILMTARRSGREGWSPSEVVTRQMHSWNHGGSQGQLTVDSKGTVLVICSLVNHNQTYSIQIFEKKRGEDWGEPLEIINDGWIPYIEKRCFGKRVPHDHKMSILNAYKGIIEDTYKMALFKASQVAAALIGGVPDFTLIERKLSPEWVPKLQIGSDSQGNITALWSRATSNDYATIQGIFRDSDGVWDLPRRVVYTDGTFYGEWLWRAHEPLLIIHPDGYSVVAFKDDTYNRSTHLRCSRRSNNNDWMPSEFITNSDAFWGNIHNTYICFPQISMDKQGNIGAAWISFGPSVDGSYLSGSDPWFFSVHTSYLSHATGSWTAPSKVSSEVRLNDEKKEYFSPPSVALGPNGQRVIAWVLHQNEEYTVQVVEQLDEGAWSQPVNISSKDQMYKACPKLMAGHSGSRDLFYLEGPEGEQSVIFQEGKL